ncbi:MAG: hypothetical protein Q8K92_06160 [Leadbetterella sp.]|nr:hypothetical protein [Leadbetterella sp.]
MKKIKSILEFTVKSRIFIVLGIISGAAIVALSIFGAAKDFNDVYFNSKRFPLYGLILFAVSFIIALISTLITFIANKEVARESYVTNDRNVKINSLFYHRLIIIINSQEFNDIIEKHLKNIRVYFKYIISEVNNRINLVVNVDTLDRYEKTKNDLDKQRAFMNSIFKELSNLNEIEKNIKKEHKDCIDEIYKHLIDWSDKNEHLKQVYNFPKFTYNNKYDKKEFKLDLDDIRNDLFTTRSNIKDINIQKIVFGNNNVTDLGLSAALVLLRMDTEDVGDFLTDNIIDGEVTEQAIYNILENVGASIPLIAPAFIALKFFRYLYRSRDRSEEIENLKNEISQSIEKYLNNICDRSVERVKEDSNKYMNDLIAKFKANFEKANHYKEKAEPYL